MLKLWNKLPVEKSKELIEERKCVEVGIGEGKGLGLRVKIRSSFSE